MPPDLNVTPEFLRAGRAIFTVSNPPGAGHTHHTYRLREWQGNLLAELLRGPDNLRAYQYIGRVDLEAGRVWPTKKSTLHPKIEAWLVLEWALQVVIGLKPMRAGYKIQHAGRCGRCGRILTHPESLETGFGPECWEAVK